MRLVLAVIISCASLCAHAGTAGPVKLKNLFFMPNGVVIAYTDGPRSSPPPCATESARFALDANTSAGKARLAGLLTAYTSGKSVNIWGTASCTAWGDTESIDFFSTVDP